VRGATDARVGREYDGDHSLDRELAFTARFGEVGDMAQQRGGQGRAGLLIRASDGSLWLMRDGAAAPEKLKEDVAEKINHLLSRRESQRQISGSSPDVQKILREDLGIGEPDGIIIWW